MPSLQILKGANEGAVITLGNDPLVLGRNPDCDVVIFMRTVSRRHAQIVRVGDSYFLDDLQSRNGTFVNNVEVQTRTALKNNDRIRICDFIAAFLELPPAPLPVPAVNLDPPGGDEGTVAAYARSIPPFLTQAEWQISVDPVPMLEFLSTTESGTQRKFRLFICACARRIWHLLRHPANQRGVEVAERFADHEATDEELAEVREEMVRGGVRESMVAYYAARESRTIVRYVARQAARAVEAARGGSWEEHRVAERAEQAALVRDLFPPYPSLTVEPAWLCWEGGVVPSLAQAAYDQRCLPEGTLEPVRLGVLADALEDAGCTCAELLGHLRGPGPHVRGCWAVDLLRSGIPAKGEEKG
jgi:pSer/pThr/pTyr-binding forkhead associated (FHA) protein